MTTNYVKQADDLLVEFGVTFSAVLIGSDCPPFCEDAAKRRELDKVNVYPRKSHIHGKHYRCIFTRPQREYSLNRGNPEYFPVAPFVVDFWNSYADEEFNALGSRDFRAGVPGFKYGRLVRDGRQVNKKGLQPTPYDILACIQKGDVGTFGDFCSDLGYDEDSRKAEGVYRAIVDEWKRVKAFFTEAEIEKLQDVA